MTLLELPRIFVPHMLESAHRRWPGAAITLYALGLADPLGRVIAASLCALEMAADYYRKVATAPPSLVMVGAMRSTELLNLLHGLVEADHWFSLVGEAPLAEGAEVLRATLEQVTRQRTTAVLFVAGGVRIVLTLDEAAPFVLGSLFGGGTEIGQS